MNLNASVGIIGVKTTSKSTNGEDVTYNISLSGTAKYNKIPKVILFCEDIFAEKMITYALSEININSGSFKFIKCGVWHNIIKALAGGFIYEEELIESGNHKTLKAVGVIDGDITEENISKAIGSAFKGNYLPDKLSKVSTEIHKNIASFHLSHDNFTLPENSTGTPEFNIKMMLDEINEITINDYHKEEMVRFKESLSKVQDENSKMLFSHEIDIIESKINETLDIIEISKSIIHQELPKNTSGKFDYHHYFIELKKRLGNKFFKEYSFIHEPELLVYRIISTYNKKRWLKYIEPVTGLLKNASDEQIKRFSKNTFNNDSLD